MKTKLIFLLITLNFCLLTQSKALPYEIDLASIDSIAAEYIDKSTYYWNYNPDSSIYYAKLALERSKISKSKFLEGLVLNYVGTAYDLNHQTLKAIIYHENALKIGNELKNTYLISTSSYYLGLCYYSKKIHDKAIEYFNIALELDFENKDTLSIANDYLHIGYVYQNLKYYDKAKENFLEGKKFFEFAKNHSGIAISILELAKIALQTNEIKKASVLFEKALNAYKISYDVQGVAVTEMEYAKLLLQQNEIKKSIDLLTKAVVVLKKFNDSRGQIEAELVLVEALIKNKQIKQAESIAVQILERSVIIQDFQYQIEALKLLSQIAEQKNQFEKALYYQKSIGSLTDSINNSERTRLEEEMIIRFEVKKQANLLEKLSVERDVQAERLKLQYYGIIILFFLIGILTLLIFAYLKKSHVLVNANKELESRSKRISEQKEAISILVKELQELNSSQKQKSEALENLNDTKGKLLAIISHDFRGPLVQLKSFIDLIRKKQITEEQIEKSFSQFGETVDITLNFLDNLLFWAKYQLNGIKVNKTKIDITDIIKNTISLTENQASVKNIAITLSLESETSITIADSDMLHLAFRNLLANAIKFSNNDSEIKIKINSTEKVHTVTIADQGIGIEPIKLKQLFQGSFFQRSSSRQERSTGIGLMLSYDFVTLNGGTIGVNSQLGLGTTFFIKLPRFKETPVETITQSN